MDFRNIFTLMSEKQHGFKNCKTVSPLECSTRWEKMCKIFLFSVLETTWEKQRIKFFPVAANGDDTMNSFYSKKSPRVILSFRNFGAENFFWFNHKMWLTHLPAVPPQRDLPSFLSISRTQLRFLLMKSLRYDCSKLQVWSSTSGRAVFASLRVNYCIWQQTDRAEITMLR